MAIASLTRVESHITPPATPVPSVDAKNFEPVDTTPKACMSKNCIHKKKEDEDAQKKKKSKSRSKHEDSDTSDSDSDSDLEEDSDDSTSESGSDTGSEVSQPKVTKSRTEKASANSRRRRRRGGRRRKMKKSKKEVKSDEQTQEPPAATDNAETVAAALEALIKSAGLNLEVKRTQPLSGNGEKKPDVEVESTASGDDDDDDAAETEEDSKSKKKSSKKDKKKDKKKGKNGSKADFKRLDEIWDEDLYDYKLKETSEEKTNDQYDEYIFTVRRKFDDDGRLQKTFVYIKSEPLKEVLSVVLSDIECISLVEEVPQIEPNTLFLFVEDFRSHLATLKKEKRDASKKKVKKALATKREHLQVLIKYLDKDYEETKKRLDPLLQSGRISFDLMWALFKPNTLAYSSTYNDDEQPRSFKIASSYVTRSFAKGVYYEIEGQHLDFDGKNFGVAECFQEVSAFQGTRKINSLSCYPLHFHSDSEKLKVRLLERGKKFLTSKSKC